MKYVLVGITGLLLGAAAAAAVVYFNPLTANRADGAVAASDWQLGYSFPGPDVLLHTHGGRLPSARLPAGVTELWEETIRSTALTSMRLDDGRDGRTAWATRITVPSSKTNPIFNGLIVGDHWLISVPGAGSLFVTADANLWPVLKDTFVRVDVLRRPWRGPASYSPTLSFESSSPVMHGATGSFAGLEGRGVDTFEVAGYGRAGGLESLNGNLALEFDGAGPFAELPAAE